MVVSFCDVLGHGIGCGFEFGGASLGPLGAREGMWDKRDEASFMVDCPTQLRLIPRFPFALGSDYRETSLDFYFAAKDLQGSNQIKSNGETHDDSTFFRDAVSDHYRFRLIREVMRDAIPNSELVF